MSSRLAIALVVGEQPVCAQSVARRQCAQSRDEDHDRKADDELSH